MCCYPCFHSTIGEKILSDQDYNSLPELPPQTQFSQLPDYRCDQRQNSMNLHSHLAARDKCKQSRMLFRWFHIFWSKHQSKKIHYYRSELYVKGHGVVSTPGGSQADMSVFSKVATNFPFMSLTSKTGGTFGEIIW